MPANHLIDIFSSHSNPTVGLNLCPLTGKTFSTFPPLLSLSSQDETSRTRLPEGFICCLNWPDLHYGVFSLKKNIWYTCKLPSSRCQRSDKMALGSGSPVPDPLGRVQKWPVNIGFNEPGWVWTCWPSKSSRVNFSFQNIEEQLQFSVFPLYSSSTLGGEEEAWHCLVFTFTLT